MQTLYETLDDSESLPPTRKTRADLSIAGLPATAVATLYG